MSNKRPKRSEWYKAFTGQTARVDRSRGNNGEFNTYRAAPVPRRGSQGLNPAAQNYSQRYNIVKTIAHYVPTGEVSVDGFALKVFVYTPATLLRMRANVFFEADANLGVDPAFNVVPDWSITSMVREPMTGRESPLQQLYPDTGSATPLPDQFTADEAGEVIRLNINLDNNQFKTAFVPVGTRAYCKLVVSWEPNTLIPPGDLQKYFEMCKVAYGREVQIQNVSIP